MPHAMLMCLCAPRENFKKWDTCAPHCLLMLLGGDIFDLHGMPIRYSTAAASPPRLPCGSQTQNAASTRRQSSVATRICQLGLLPSTAFG